MPWRRSNIRRLPKEVVWVEATKMIKRGMFVYRRIMKGMFPIEHENRRWIIQLNMNKEVESQSGKSIKDFGFTLLLNFNLNATINAEYIRETNYNHSWFLQIIQDEYRLNPEQKNVYDIILSSVNGNEWKIFFRCSWRHG